MAEVPEFTGRGIGKKQAWVNVAAKKDKKP
jgi:hypothetical protein